MPTREALILQATINYPWLLHDHLEELVSLEFRHGEAEKLKAALIDTLPQPARSAVSRLAARVEAWQKSRILLISPDIELR